MVLKSVKVYAGDTKDRIIELRNSAGTLLQSDTINVPAGESRITLNFNIPVGNDMRLSCGTANPNMYRDDSGISFPYTLAGKISITGTNAGSTRYYYYYDWEIETPGCTSSRVPVTATIITQPVAGFNSSVVSFTGNFTNTSTGAATYFWNFGDASTSTDPNPSHIYTAPGTYTVMLIAANGSCADTTYQDVTILPTGGIDDNVFAHVSMFPNPARNEITIMPGSAVDGKVQIDIFSITGELVFSKNLYAMNSKTSIDISSLTNGAYSLRLINGENQKYFRIIKSE